MDTKLKYATSLPGYGTGGVDGSAGLLGFSVYFTNYSGDTNFIELEDLITLNKPLLDGSHFPGGYPNRMYQTGDVFVDSAGKVWEINLSLPNKYEYAGYVLSSKSLFVLSNTGIAPTERWSNQYPFNIVDTVNSNTLTSSYYTDYPDTIYGIDSKKFARIEYSNKVEAGGRNVFSLFIGAAADSSDNYAIGLVRDIASNSFRIGNLDSNNNLRPVNLNFDVKSLKKNTDPFVAGSADGTLLTNREIDTKNLINPFFTPDPASFRFESPVSTYTTIYWDKRDFLETTDPAIVDNIQATLVFQQNKTSYAGVFNYLDGVLFREMSFPNLETSGSLRITDLPFGYYYRAYIVFQEKGWKRFSKVINVIPGADPVVLVITNPNAICFPGTRDLTAPAITAGSTPPGLTFTYWTDSGATVPYSTPTTAGGGIYYIKATDGITQDIKPVDVTVNPLPSISISSNQPGNTFCAGTNVTFTATSGLENYVFRINGSNVQNGLSNTYSSSTLTNGQSVDVVGTNFNGCSNTSSPITVTVNISPIVVVTNPTAICYPGTRDLTAAAVTTGSTPGITFTYWTDSGATSPYSTPTTAPAGTYYIKGTAPGGCYQIQPVTVTVNSLPVAEASNSGFLCEGGTITLTGGPSGMSSYSWTGPNGFTSSSQSPTVSTNATTAMSGTYSLSVTNSNGCTSASPATTEVSVSVIPSITSTTPGSRCGTGFVDLSAVASAGQVLWYSSPSGGYIEHVGPDFTVMVGSTTTYYAEATTADIIVGTPGCTSERVAVVATIVSNPTVNIIQPAPVELPGTVDLTAAIITSGSTPGLTFTYWTNPSCTTSYSTPATASEGTYYIKGTMSGGCFAVGSVTVTQYSIPVVGFRDDGSIDLTALGSKIIQLTIKTTANINIQLGWASDRSGSSFIDIVRDYSNIGGSSVYASAPDGGNSWSSDQDIQTYTVSGLGAGSYLYMNYDVNACECGQDADVACNVVAEIIGATVTSGGGTVTVNYPRFDAQYESCCAYLNTWASPPL